MKKILLLSAVVLVAAGCDFFGTQQAPIVPPTQPPVTQAPPDELDAAVAALERSAVDEEALQKQPVTDVLRTDKQLILKIVNEATDDTDY